MSRLENVFQERLDMLQQGEPLEACVDGLPQDEAELLALAVGLGKVAYPEPSRDVAAAQRAELLRLAAKERKMNAQSSKPGRTTARSALPKWFVPVMALSGVVVVLFLCALIVVAGAGVFWWRSRDVGVPSRVASYPSVEVRATRTSTPRPVPTSTSEARVTPELTSTPRSVPTSAPEVRSTLEPTSTPTAEPTVQEVAPVVAPLEAPDAQSAMLRDMRGLVQVQEAEDTWRTIPARGCMVRAGDRVRTGALSSVNLAFYDGSVAYLGPNAKVSIDELDARASGEPRVIVLTQWVGETEHDVVPSTDDGSRYEVNTPSGSGVAKGTVFRVLVTPSGIVHFRVDRGMVAVTHLDVTVLVVAGQVTTVSVDQVPSEPYFRVSGEGKVEQIGDTWRIAGQDFETHDATVIVGNPRVGDWVFVDGHLLADGTRVADRIVLLRRAAENRFTIQGQVEAIADAAWTVAGQTILVNEGTHIQEGIEEDAWVRVEGIIAEDGTLFAERILLIEEEEPGLSFHFVGVVGDIADESWAISGISITVNAETELDEDLAVGDVVQVYGRILEDETWLAYSIRRLEAQERAFEFTGYVESMDPWIVSGIPVETREWTEIEAGIAIDDAVKVKGRILEDGTWLATEIVLLDDGDRGLYVEFVGTVDSVDPWIVSGRLLAVDDETEIQGEITVDTLVKVEAEILPDGTWVIREMRPIDTTPGRGCVHFTSVVVRVDASRVVLHNGVTLSLDGGVYVEGEIEVYSVVLLQVCVDADGSLTVVSIIVIYQMDPALVPTPTPVPLPTSLPTQPEEPEPDDGNVTICHKPGTPAEKTMTVPQSALQSHLNHGDTIGPCP